MSDSRQRRKQVDTASASAARLYDAFQRGKNGYEVDYEVAQEVQKHIDMEQVAPANRAFHNRSIEYAGTELGITQFLDIGTGMPQEPNTHQIAQHVKTGARVVYVDNDPIVMRHAEALLHSSPGGVTDYVHADLRDPQAILAAARGTLDFEQPIAVLLIAVLHFVADQDRPVEIVADLLDPLAPGSCLLLTHFTDEFAPESCRAMEEIYREQGITLVARSREAIAAVLEPLDLIPPGLVEVQHWRPGPGDTPPSDVHLHTFGAVGLKKSL
ncbi:SAM-dependent methyltransferase [Streptomyces sp. NPDC050560]|uniref:SAM-dependent methyltransferase n=1 Tax=Streptomyces sp. NPDC050560 TaxID=3365630 RepID=UPI0037937BDD